MIDPVEKEIQLPDGSYKTFTLTKFNAIDGREIVTQYPLSGLPKIGDYKTNEEIMLKIMKHVFVKTGDVNLALSNKELVNNHIPEWETLAKIELEMMRYNCSFFSNGAFSTFLGDLVEKVPALITKILTDSLAPLSQKEKPPSTS